jgi:hypothetical protein
MIGAKRPNADERKCKRRWFQFSLRTLLIGATLLAVACGYVGRQFEIVRERKSLLTWLIEIGGAYSIPAGGEIPFPDDYYGNRWLMASERLLKAGDADRALPWRKGGASDSSGVSLCSSTSSLGSAVGTPTRGT